MNRSRLSIVRSASSEVDIEMVEKSLETGWVGERVSDSELIPQDLVVFARRLKAMRNERLAFFDPDLFGEPAWDMLLALFIAHGEQYRLKVNEVTEQSGAPPTTALRWIGKLEELGLVFRVPHPSDQRSVCIELQQTAVRRISAYIERIRTRYAPAS